MSSTRTAWLQIHFCVVLWGFTAILGKLITLAALPLVWWRMLLVAAALLLVSALLERGARNGAATHRDKRRHRHACGYALARVLRLDQTLERFSCRDLHGADAGVPSLSSNLYLSGGDSSRRELVFGLAVIPGVALVVGGAPNGMRTGIVVGAISWFFCALFATLNKRHISSGDTLSVTGVEMAAGVLFLAAFMERLLPFNDTIFALPDRHDGVLLVVLSMGCTLLPFALSLVALRQLSAFSTSLAVNLEPVYAIALATLLLGEQRELKLGFYLGVAIILAVVFLHPLVGRRSPAPG